jgi:hypothetical protein
MTTRMKTIEFKVTFGDGNEYIVSVQARDINSGFRKAAAEALRNISPDYDIHSVEFWMVRDR